MYRIPFLLVASTLALLPCCAQAQAASDPHALQIVHAAVDAEVDAAQHDKSNWMYFDHDAVPGKDAVYYTVETPHGSLRRMVQLDGRTVTAEQRAAESNRIADYVHDTSAQAKSHRNGEHDDAQAQALLRQMPDAYIWTMDGESPEGWKLSYKPNPAFAPPSMESRVFAALSGTMIVTRDGDRIRTLRGELGQDLKMAMGLVHLLKGGSFDVERREIAPGIWQITEQHVHISGHALLFKTIGEQEDEEKTQFERSTAATLQQAEELLEKK